MKQIVGVLSTPPEKSGGALTPLLLSFYTYEHYNQHAETTSCLLKVHFIR